MTAVEVMLKGQPTKDADGYVRGISRKNSQLHVIPGLVHLEKDEIRQGYKCCIEVINLGTTCYKPCSIVFYSIWCHPVAPLLQLITALSLSLFPFSIVFFPLYYFPFSYFSWCLFYPFLIWFCPCFLPQKCCFCVPFYSCHNHISTVFSLPSHFSLLSKCSPCLLPWINLHFWFDLWFGFAFVLSVSPEIQSIWQIKSLGLPLSHFQAWKETCLECNLCVKLFTYDKL